MAAHPRRVEVVGGQVEPGARHRARSGGSGSSRNDEASTTNTSTAGIVDGGDEGDLGVAHGDRGPAAGHQHRPDELGDGGLPVGPRDRDARAVVPAIAPGRTRTGPARAAPAASANTGGGRARLGSEAPPRHPPPARAAPDRRAPRRARRPARAARARPASDGRSSTATTPSPWRTRARATARPVTPSPSTRWSVNPGRPCRRSRRRRARAPCRRTPPTSSQKRTRIVVSGQPPSSKWWWIGAMRKTRRPFKNRKLLTCSTTDTISTT